MAAVRAKGCTLLRNCARDPEVTDTANFLNQMGAKIIGAGTDTIRIEGVPYLKTCTYTAIPDRLIAGAFLISVGVTGGTITVPNIIPEHLSSCVMSDTIFPHRFNHVNQLKRMGADIKLRSGVAFI
jgi:UDP-N-acetylglucosamine 1-carboxyvinyltransferase